MTLSRISLWSRSMNDTTTITNANAAYTANRSRRASNDSNSAPRSTVAYQATPNSTPVTASTIR